MSTKPGRNDPCPCGSGKKYKKCCAQTVASADPSTLASLASTGRYEEMEAVARRLVTEDSSSGLAWKALGVALRIQGKDALSALETAAKLLPGDAEAQSNLGGALRSLGRFEEAVSSYRRAIAINPMAAGIHSNLGNALKDLGRVPEAVESFTRALDLKPDLAQAHNNLGNALQDLGQLVEAALCYGRAIALKPDYVEAHTNLAIVRRLQSRESEAQVACENALTINPQYVSAICLLAELQADQGQFAEAEQTFRRAIAIEPESAEAWAGIAALRKMTTEDSDWLGHAQRLAERPIAPRQELDLRYAIGKYFDDIEEFDQAFVNYRRANELTKTLRAPHDQSAISQAIDRIIEAYGEEWPGAATAESNTSERPVLIVGMPRSGTTLAEQILGSHPQVFGAGEQPYWSTAAQSVDLARLNGRINAGMLSRLADEYLQVLEGLSSGALRVIDKMPANFLYLGLVHAALPRARIIHMRRDPVDTCLSIYFQRFGVVHTYANDLHDLAHYYAEYLRLMDHWRRVLPARTLLEVNYEDLVANPEAGSRQMLEFLGLPWDSRCLEFHRFSRTVSTFSKWQARQAITQSSVGRSRNYQGFIRPLLNLRPASATP